MPKKTTSNNENQATSNEQRKMWGGRFREPAHPLMEEFGASVHFDQRLASYDILGSIAHTRMLAYTKIISAEAADKITAGLKNILEAVKNGQFKWDKKLEDVHTNIESRLRIDIGEIADFLHTARSRNDQVVLDLRMYLKDEVLMIIGFIRKFQGAILDLAKNNMSVIIPGYTHLQRAQPVLIAHHLAAYLEMLERDVERLQEGAKRMDCLPLGSCALAGTSFKTDRVFLAKELGFSKVMENSMDAVSDRDFVIETVSTLALLGVHLSRMSEEMILWSSFEFGFVELPDEFTTGSSAMPQKKNPDAFELIRGKSARLIGHLTQLMVLLKGLPLTYNRDLQEDKEAVFDSVDTVKNSLEILAALIPKIKIKAEFLQNKEDYSSSLDLAEYLVKKGVPFRQAHDIVGKLVSYCLAQNKTFNDLTLSEVRQCSEKFDVDFKNLLSWEASVKAKQSFGSTNPEEVKKAIKKWENRLKVSR